MAITSFKKLGNKEISELICNYFIFELCCSTSLTVHTFVHICAPAAHTVKNTRWFIYGDVFRDHCTSGRQRWSPGRPEGSAAGIHGAAWHWKWWRCAVIRCSQSKAEFCKKVNDALTVSLCRDVGPPVQDLSHAEHRLHWLSRWADWTKSRHASHGASCGFWASRKSMFVYSSNMNCYLY